MMNHSTILVKAVIALFGALFAVAPAADSTQISQYVRDIQAGPSTWYTPEAYAWYLSRSSVAPGGVSVDRDAASRSFSAITKMCRLPVAEARSAIPAIVALFPKIVHVVQIRGASFGGNEGTFDDCVGTYVTNAKTQFIVSPPILNYDFLSSYENFIDESHEVDIISKRVDASGQIVEAAFNLRIFLTVYVGEGVLTRLTGQTLGHDQRAWSQAEAGLAPPPTPEVRYQSAPSATPAATLAPAYTPVPPGTSSIGLFTPGRSYHLSLTTDNELDGKVISQDGSSVTIITTAGKSYVIPMTLIKSCSPLDLSAIPGTP